jgi:uncharacterized delta-60 repeat protein
MKFTSQTTSGLRTTILLLLAIFVSALSVLFAQSVYVDESFNTRTSPHYYANCLLEQPDGKILVGAGFNHPNSGPVRLSRLNADGTIDNSFNVGVGPGPNVSGLDRVFDMALQPDGKIVIVGRFTEYDEQPANRIARLNPDGSRDVTFNSAIGYDNDAYTVAIQADGKILIGGGGGFKRLNADGSADNAFNASVNIQGTVGVNNIVVQPDGKIIVGGQFNTYNSVSVGRLIRINPNASIDPGFNIALLPVGDVHDIELLADGKMLVTGDSKVMRLDANGFADPTFTAATINGGVYANSVAIQADGKIIAAGLFTSINGSTKNRIVRLNPNGGVDATFNMGVGFDDAVYDLKISSSGKILVGGSFKKYNNNNTYHFAILNSDGTIYSSGHTGQGPDTGSEYVYFSTLQNDGKLIIGGNFVSFSSMPINRIARLQANGHLDDSFNTGTGANAPVYAGVVQNDSKVIIGGSFTSYNGSSAKCLTRLNVNGSIDPSFLTGTGANALINSIALQPDGKILVGGDFTIYNGTTVSRIMRLNADGTIDATFSSTGANGLVRRIILLPDGKILIAGEFTTYNGVSRARIARINADGTLDVSFDPGTGANGPVFAMRVQPDGKIIVDGTFTQYNGSSASKIVRIHTTGARDLGFTPPVWAATLGSLAVLPDDKILVAVGHQMCFLNPDGTQNSLVTLVSSGSYYDFSFDPAGRLITSGAFGTISNNQLRRNIVRFGVCSPVSSVQTVNSCGSYTWIDGNTYTSNNSTATYVFPDANGCDSTVTLNLTISTATTSSVSEVSCDSYTWPQNGTTYTTSGQYYDTIPNAGGCDSIITLDLTINVSTSSSIAEVACGSYIWLQNGMTYTTTGQYFDTIPNANGCDSIITLDLTINTATTSSVTESACDSYTWPQNGVTYTVSGQYFDTIPNANGCDSVIVLNFDILIPTSATETISSPGSYTWPINGETYTASGSYIDTIPNAAGCDSIITLNLSIYVPTVVNTFSLPSDVNECTGGVAITTEGVPNFIYDIGNGDPVSTSEYALIDSLCPGIYSVLTTDGNGDTVSTVFIIPADTNYIFNNPFIDSIAVDSLGITLEECDVFYNGIDTAYIADIFANADTITVTWDIIDANGITTTTTTYILGNGNGVYYLQLDVYCPQKIMGSYFAATQSVYFENGAVHLVDIAENALYDAAVFPNPTDNNVTVTFSEPIVDLSVTDMQGKVVFKRTIHNNEQVSLKNVQSGIYFFELTSPNGRMVKRVVRN